MNQGFIGYITIPDKKVIDVFELAEINSWTIQRSQKKQPPSIESYLRVVDRKMASRPPRFA